MSRKRRVATGHLATTDAVAERLVALSEELRVASDRTRVLALEAERKTLATLAQIYQARDEYEQTERLAASTSKLEAHLNGHTGVETTDTAPPFIVPGDVQ